MKTLLLITCVAAFIGCPPMNPGEGMGEGTGEGAGEGQGEMPVPDATDHFFVDTTRGNDQNTGRRDTPFATIQQGINSARSMGGTVFVAGGVYNRTIRLESAVEIIGGYDSSDWILDRENFPTIVDGDSQSAVSGSDVIGARLVGIQIVDEISEEVFPNSIAIQLVDSQDITLEDCMLFPSNGTDGQNGLDGADRDQGPPGEDGGDAGPCDGSISGGVGGANPINKGLFVGGDGGEGRTGSGEDGERGGGDGVGGIAVGGDGGPGGALFLDGENGIDGDDSDVLGLPGVPGTEIGTFDDNDYRPAHGTSGVRGGSGGSGGGGGGGGGGGSTLLGCGAGGGGGGAFGSGGDHGRAGLGGGASIGVLLNDSTGVRLINCIISTGNGGDGGNGGEGGLGGPGGLGGNGGARSAMLGAGGNGGNGGAGADGGHGGAGGGGPAIGIALTESSDVTLTDTMIMLGTPGVGGISPGGPDLFGADGIAAEMYDIPADDDTTTR